MQLLRWQVETLLLLNLKNLLIVVNRHLVHLWLHIVLQGQILHLIIGSNVKAPLALTFSKAQMETSK